MTRTINLYGFYLNIIDIYCTFVSEMRKMVDDIISRIMEIGSEQYHSAPYNGFGQKLLRTVMVHLSRTTSEASKRHGRLMVVASI